MRLVFGSYIAVAIVALVTLAIVLGVESSVLFAGWMSGHELGVLDPHSNFYILHGLERFMRMCAYGALGWTAFTGVYIALMVLGVLLVGDLGVQFGLFTNEYREIDRVQNRILLVCGVLILSQAFVGFGSWLLLYFLNLGVDLASVTLTVGLSEVVGAIIMPILLIAAGLSLTTYVSQTYSLLTDPPRFPLSPRLRDLLRQTQQQ